MIHGIFAADSLGGIGLGGSLPWPHNKEDLNKFKEITSGHVVVMGRRTWDDPKMPKPLPGRINVVFTNRAIRMAGVRSVSGDVRDRITELQDIYPNKNIFVIGGKQLIEESSILFNNLYLTHIKGNYRADTRIHLDRFLAGFRALSAGPSSDRSCTFMVYKNLFRA